MFSTNISHFMFIIKPLYSVDNFITTIKISSHELWKILRGVFPNELLSHEISEHCREILKMFENTTTDSTRNENNTFSYQCIITGVSLPGKNYSHVCNINGNIWGPFLHPSSPTGRRYQPCISYSVINAFRE